MEDLCGTRNDLSSSVAELGHRRVERVRGRKEEEKRENGGSFRVQRKDTPCLCPVKLLGYFVLWCRASPFCLSALPFSTMGFSFSYYNDSRRLINKV